MENPAPLIAGLILAGGRASRMGGGDKSLILLQERSLLDHCRTRLAPQVSRLLLSANGDPKRFAKFGLTVLADPIGDHWGPLAGILAGLEHLAAERPEIGLMVSAPTDCPFLPIDLVAGLLAARQDQQAEIVMAESDGRLQPVCALWPVNLAGSLRRALLGGVRKVDQFARSQRLATVSWPEQAFFNINQPDDLNEALKRL
jgi:molybdopterin-guanine dinucleotide biosynthesis protein A